MSEMELMCDRVGIIVRGTVKSVQTIEEMLKSIDTSTATYLYKVNDAEAAKIMIGEKYPAYEIACDGDSEFKLTVTAENANELIESNKETDEHKRILMKICAEIAKEKEESEGKE